MIITTIHFEKRVNERFISNNYNKIDFVINTFKKIYKKNKLWLKNIKITQENSKYWVVYKMCYDDFKYYYSINWSDIVLITFWIRCKE